MAPGDGELAARVEALEAERGVVATLHAYCHAIDAGDEVGWADCFTADGRFTVHGRNPENPAVDVRGREALLGFAAGHSRRPDAYHQHCVIDPVVTIDGGEAAVTSGFLVLLRHEGKPRVLAFGRYQDQLRREPDGRWRLVWRDASVDGSDRELPAISFARETGEAGR